MVSMDTIKLECLLSGDIRTITTLTFVSKCDTVFNFVNESICITSIYECNNITANNNKSRVNSGINTIESSLKNIDLNAVQDEHDYTLSTKACVNSNINSISSQIAYNLINKDDLCDYSPIQYSDIKDIISLLNDKKSR